jgi:dissimilatory sulfite reductase (desulfoviridin) alpha/beta subunit
MVIPSRLPPVRCQVMTAAQSIIFRDVDPKDKAAVDQILASHGVQSVDTYDNISRYSMACPALPLCGLAVTEAERVMPDFTRQVRSLHLSRLSEAECDGTWSPIHPYATRPGLRAGAVSPCQ